MSGKYRNFDAFFAEAEAEAIKFTVKGRDYSVPPSPSLKAVSKLQSIQRLKGPEAVLSELHLQELGVDLLGQKQYDTLIEDGITLTEFEHIFTWIWDRYKNIGKDDDDGEEAGSEGNKKKVARKR